MKNLKVSMKLFLGFSIVILLSGIIGFVAIYGMYRMNVADNTLYHDNYLPTVMAGNISQTIVEQRVFMRNFIVFDKEEELSMFRETERNLELSKQKMDQLLEDYESSILKSDDRDAFDEFVKLYRSQWLSFVQQIHDLGQEHRGEEATEVLRAGAPVAERMDQLTTALQDVNLADGKATVNGNTSLFKRLSSTSVIVMIASIIISVFLALRISSLISMPVGFMKDILHMIGRRGKVVLSDSEYIQATEYAHRKDEIGESIQMLIETGTRLQTVEKTLETVANGDLTSEISLLSQDDIMGMSLNKMMENLNHMFGNIHTSASHVSTASKQISQGAHTLAEGSAQQAAAVQQLSGSISEIARKTKENSDRAGKAALLANTIKNNAEKGNLQMIQMMEAVKEINQASQSISKVIKVIDDIAFQTNILALNAAVEAARAGQHGKGFAVVAEEVRNLAAKSAEAAKDTGGLIANSMEKAEFGAHIADETAASLTEIVSGINESASIVSDIARSSEEQSGGISEINKGIEQVAHVVSQNSATSEQSAAASEEMSGQADMLEELLSQFRLKDANTSSFGIFSHDDSKNLRLAINP